MKKMSLTFTGLNYDKLAKRQTPRLTFFKQFWFQESLLPILVDYLKTLTNQILSDISSRTRVLHYLHVNVLPYKNNRTC